MSTVRPHIIFIKALVLYAIANFAFAYFNPPVGKLSIYNWLVPGRQRAPYDREIDYYDTSHTIPIYEDMDAMYQSMTLSLPKQKDEFRIFLIGDSSAWGFQLHPNETLVAQLNSLSLKTCDGKRILVYNAAFPLPYVMKDLMIIDKVREYDPDMFLWTITLDGFRNRGIFTNYFLNPYPRKVSDLVNQYRLLNLETDKMAEQTFWDRTIVGQRSHLKKIFILQLYGFGWSATGLDYTYEKYEPLSQDQLANDLYLDTPREEFILNQMLFDVMSAIYQHVGQTPLLAVNEPVFVATGVNSDIRYNEFYPRWAYDEYMTYLDEWMRINHHDYVNAWNLLPPSEFTDTPFHRTPAGEKAFAEYLVPQILNLSCTK